MSLWSRRSVRRPPSSSSTSGSAAREPTGDDVSRETAPGGVQGDAENASSDAFLVLFPTSHGDPTDRPRAAATGQRVGPADGAAGDLRVPRLPLSPDLVPDVWPLPGATRIVAIANQKGGVGKTTTTVNLAVALADAGARVVVVDCDPQGNATTAFGVVDRSRGTYDVLVDGAPMDQMLVATEEGSGLSVLAAGPDLAGAQVELVAAPSREFRLRDALRDWIEGLDEERRPHVVLLDCPPGLDLLTVNALVSADIVLVPMQCEYYSLEGLSQLEATIGQVREYLNPGLIAGPILFTMFDPASELSAEVVADVRAHFPERAMDTVIPRCPDVSVAPSHSKSVVGYRPYGRGAQAYRVAAYELAQRLTDLQPGAATPETSDRVGVSGGGTHG